MKKVEELSKCNLWLHGPDIIRTKDIHPPVEAYKELSVDDAELKKEAKQCLSINAGKHQDIMQFERFSNWTKMVNTMARVCTWIENAENKSRQPLKNYPPVLSNNAIEKGKLSLIKIIQRSLKEEFQSAAKQNKVPNTIKSLDPFRSFQLMVPRKNRSI